MWLRCCIDLLQDQSVCLITCNIQQLWNKTAMAAYKSLITCSYRQAVSHFLFLLCHLSSWHTRLLSVCKASFFKKNENPQLPHLCHLSVPKAAKWECRSAATVTSTNHWRFTHMDLWDTDWSPSSIDRSQAFSEIVYWAQQQQQQSRNKPTSITGN